MNRTLFWIFASLSIACGAAETGSGGGIDGGDAAIALVRRALEEHRAYPPEQMRLLMFFADPAEDGSVEVSARWNNRKIPGADPDVAPMAAMFRVGRDRKTIEWLDVLEGDYRPFARFLEGRREP